MCTGHDSTGWLLCNPDKCTANLVREPHGFPNRAIRGPLGSAIHSARFMSNLGRLGRYAAWAEGGGAT